MRDAFGTDRRVRPVLLSVTRGVSAAAAALLATACAGTGATWGERGVVRLGWTDGALECSDACSLDLPLATGARAYLRIDNREDLPALTLRSRETAVLTLVASPIADDLFLATGVAVGAARIEVEDEAGVVVDGFVVEVRDAATLELAGASSPLELGDRWLEQFARVRDRDGAELRGFGGVVYEPTSNVEVTTPIDWRTELLFSMTGASGRGASSEYLELRGDGSGTTGALRVVAPAGTTTLPLVALAPSATAITLADEAVEYGVRVEATFEGVDLDRFDPCCAWSWSPREVSVTARERTCDVLTLGTTDPSTLQAATVTCAYGGREASLPIAVPASP